jgi:Rrf2 family protein
MKVPAKIDYGIRALIQLAMDPNRFHTLDEISSKESVPASYIPRILLELSTHGYVEARRGAKGGYRLAEQASKITLRQVFVGLAGCVITADCFSDPARCPVYSECDLREVWKEVADALTSILDSFTIQDLVERRRQRGTDTYSI